MTLPARAQARMARHARAERWKLPPWLDAYEKRPDGRLP